MYIEESYFEGEERNGFFVESMMKRAWAAQLEVLKVIEDICTKHNLRYFAERGTLLGAVRHQGYIPWDDDLDIAMLRDDYEKFLEIVKDELPEEFVLLDMYVEPEWENPFARITNSKKISWEEGRLKQFHGCPYVVGVDIFPLDYLSKNPNEEQMRLNLLGIVYQTRKKVQDKVEGAELLVQQVEELCRVKIDREQSVDRQLLILADRLSKLFGAEESEQVGRMQHLCKYNTGIREKKWYDKMIWTPFETTHISVPSDMHECAKRIFGENYMIPKVKTYHEYPFYAQQERIMQERLKAQQEVIQENRDSEARR